MSWLDRWRGLRNLGILGINGRNAHCLLDLNPRRHYPVVDDKSRMHELCLQIGVPTPELFGQIRTHSGLRHLPRLLAKRSEFVLKPARGSGGRGILVITGRDGSAFVRHNGEVVSLDRVHQHASSILSGLFSLGGLEDKVLIQELVVPDPAFARITYQGTPDVRIILYKKHPVMAMVRLPTRRAGGRANLHQGALGAGIDIVTGRTVHAVMNNKNVVIHPDTGESVIDFPVPHWSEILEMSRRVSQAIGLGYLGVDIVVDRQRGPLLLEANARPGLAIQIANRGGLLPRLQAVDRLAETESSTETIGQERQP
jgi:alpha-L-glutamate ligase-like protein